MASLAGPLAAAAVLLVLAGLNKVARPASTRVALRSVGLPSSLAAARALGLVEVVIGAATVAAGGRLAAGALGVCYLGFAWFSHRLERATRGTADCGCFGARSAPVGPIHVGVNLAIALVAFGAVVWPAGGLAASIADTPWNGVPFLALTALLTWMTYVSLTALPTALAAARTPTPADSMTASHTHGLAR